MARLVTEERFALAGIGHRGGDIDFAAILVRHGSARGQSSGFGFSRGQRLILLEVGLGLFVYVDDVTRVTLANGDIGARRCLSHIAGARALD